MSDTRNEDAIRHDLAAAYRLIALDGMDDGVSTHILSLIHI